MSQAEIQSLYQEITESIGKLNELLAEAELEEVENYVFETENGKVTLDDLFGNKEKLFVIHNMGEGCRYCTVWADGLNGFVGHLEDAMGVVLVSGDDPETQRKFANARGWRFKLASHRNSDYMAAHNVSPEFDNCPGASMYERKDGKIFKKNSCVFGPGDIYCSLWHVLALAGLGESNWTPQFRYWTPPEKLSDGGENVLD